jgi:hypothetical protein
MNESLVYLKEPQSGDLVDASLFDEVTDEHLRLWENGWVPEMQAHRVTQPPSATPEDSHWDWRRKAGAWRPLLGYQSCALVCQGELQGLMLTNDMASARLPSQFGKPIVYIEFLATAPWNRPEFRCPPKYRGCGRVFILAAIQTSIDAGYKGRIGLHSLALGKFVALWRRNRGWNAEKLAAHAGIDTAEVFEIERDPYCSPECSKSRRAAFLKSPVSLKAGHRNCANKPSASPPARNPSPRLRTPISRRWRPSSRP